MHGLWGEDFYTMIGSRLLARETEEKGKEEGKGEKKWKREENISLDIGKNEKKKMWKFYLSFVWIEKGRERKNVYFYFCILISNEKIHIFWKC